MVNLHAQITHTLFAYKIAVMPVEVSPPIACTIHLGVNVYFGFGKKTCTYNT